VFRFGSRFVVLGSRFEGRSLNSSEQNGDHDAEPRTSNFEVRTEPEHELSTENPEE
jgi:hypothetical protein